MATEQPTGFSLGGSTAQGPAGYPIGYWLRRLDRAIDSALEATLAAEGHTRRHWQTMNFLHDGPSSGPALAEALRPFWSQSSTTVLEVLADLERQGLIVGGDGQYALTPQGMTTRSRIAEQVGLTQQRLVEGVSEEEYRATLEVLQRLTANLEGH